jgi:hypothetical protein
MKAGKAHRIPLSPQAVALFKRLPKMKDTDLVFTDRSGDAMIGENAMMAPTKLGPIPDSHFENDPLPPGTYAGKWSRRFELAWIVDLARQLCVAHESRRLKCRNGLDRSSLLARLWLRSATRGARAVRLHRKIFFGAGNRSNCSPGRSRSSLGTFEYGLSTTLASGAGGGVTIGAG